MQGLLKNTPVDSSPMSYESLGSEDDPSKDIAAFEKRHKINAKAVKEQKNVSHSYESVYLTHYSAF